MTTTSRSVRHMPRISCLADPGESTTPRESTLAYAPSLGITANTPGEIPQRNGPPHHGLDIDGTRHRPTSERLSHFSAETLSGGSQSSHRSEHYSPTASTKPAAEVKLHQAIQILHLPRKTIRNKNGKEESSDIRARRTHRRSCARTQG